MGDTAFSVRDGAWQGPSGTSPRVDPEHLALGLVGGDTRLRELLEAIRGIESYSFSIEVLRQLAARSGRMRMDRRGLGWAAVLDEQPAAAWKADLIAVLTRLTSDIDDVEVLRLSGFPIARLHYRSTGRFLEASQESDGTLRVAGMVTALLQHPAPSLIAIEEPELAVHPGALGQLVDELRAATARSSRSGCSRSASSTAARASSQIVRTMAEPEHVVRRAHVVVEGHGEVSAAGNLLARVTRRLELPLRWAPPRRVKVHGGLDTLRKTAMAYRHEPRCDALLLLRDEDDDCPREKGPAWAARQRELALPFPVALVMLHREYEVLFLPCLGRMSGARLDGRPSLRPGSAWSSPWEARRESSRG